MNFKKQAAAEAVKLVRTGQIIGLGAGSTVAYLAEALAEGGYLRRLSVVTCSEDTATLLSQFGVPITDAAQYANIDLYFDGCDQIDMHLNALKSGGGIHTDEKNLAAMATECIILGDDTKLSNTLTTAFPFTIEVMPESVKAVHEAITTKFEVAGISTRETTTGKVVITKRGCLLLDVRFTVMPELERIDQIKMWPGVIDHSLFYSIISPAIICGEGRVQYLGTLPKTN